MLTLASYNAAVFQITTFNEYNVIAIDRMSEQYRQLNASSNYWNLSNTDWKQTYDKKYVSEHGDLYLAIDRVAFSTSASSSALNASVYWPLELIGANQTSIRNMTVESPDWILYDILASSRSHSWYSTGQFNVTSPVSAHVAHGFANIVRPQSRIQISLDFMIVVIVFNALKLAIMAYVLVTDKHDYIVTLGDAASSYLRRPDPTTLGQCMLGKQEMLFVRGSPPHASDRGLQIQEKFWLRTRGTWLPRSEIYFSLMGKDRQVFFALLYVSVSKLQALTNKSEILRHRVRQRTGSPHRRCRNHQWFCRNARLGYIVGRNLDIRI